MDALEEIKEIDTNQIISDVPIREKKTIVISSKHNILYMITNIFDLKPNEFDLQAYQTQNDSLEAVNQ